MPRSHFVPACLLLVPAACFAPHDPIVVTASDSESSDADTDTTPSTSGDPTATSTLSTTMSSTDTTATTSPSTTDDTADSGSSGSDTTASDSTDDGGPLCGNNMLDGDEACDDGNDINGDGCNNDCIESGTLLWELELTGAYDVAVNADDVVAVLRSENGPHVDMFDSDGVAVDSLDGPADAVWNSFDFFANGDFAVAVRGGSAIEVARISAAGAELWSSGAPGSGVYQPGTGTTRVTTTSAGDVAFAGTANAAIWGGKFDGAGVFDWSDVETIPDPGWARGTGIACEGDGSCVVVGTTDSNGNTNGGMAAFVRRLAPNGTAIWTHEYAPVSDFVDLESVRVAIAPTGDIAVVGWEDARCFMLGYTSDGDSQWTEYDDELTPNDAASDIDGNFVIAAGDVDTEAGVVKKLDPEGAELWKLDSSGTASVATDSTGRIFLVGAGWLRAYAP